MDVSLSVVLDGCCGGSCSGLTVEEEEDVGCCFALALGFHVPESGDLDSA